MTRETYRKMTGYFLQDEKKVRRIILANRLLTGIVFISYPLYYGQSRTCYYRRLCLSRQFPLWSLHCFGKLSMNRARMKNMIFHR